MMTINGEIIQKYFEEISQSLLVGISENLTDQTFWNIVRYEDEFKKYIQLNHNHFSMVEIEILSVVGSLGTAIATIVLVILLWKTIKQFETTAKLSAHQMEFRFRPWIGPVNTIKAMGEANGKNQFDVALKNYGELPATHLKASFKSDTKMMSKEVLNSEDIEKFNLGPMLPNMEKHYWFFIDCDLIQKAQEGKTKIFIALYFEYPLTVGTSGYGMISEYNPKTNSFIHKDMWVAGKNTA